MNTQDYGNRSKNNIRTLNKTQFQFGFKLNKHYFAKN